MKPAPFSYARPASMEEAVALLAAGSEERKLLAGGAQADLLPPALAAWTANVVSAGLGTALF